MRFIKFLLFLALIGFMYHFWNQHKMQVASEAVGSEEGFVPVAAIDGAARNVVLVLAAEGCPSEEAQRANRLSDRLTQMGIPNTKGDSFNISSGGDSDEERAGIDRAVAIFQQGAPFVLINGMAKSNPTAEEVAAVYKRTKHG